MHDCAERLIRCQRMVDHAALASRGSGKSLMQRAGVAMRQVAAENARAAATAWTAHGHAVAEAVTAAGRRVDSALDMGRAACSEGDSDVPCCVM